MTNDTQQTKSSRDAVPGDSVMFTGCSKHQLAYNGGADDPRSVLDSDTTYKLEDVEVHAYHTLFKLEGVEGWYPSVCFVCPAE